MFLACTSWKGYRIYFGFGLFSGEREPMHQCVTIYLLVLVVLFSGCGVYHKSDYEGRKPNAKRPPILIYNHLWPIIVHPYDYPLDEEGSLTASFSLDPDKGLREVLGGLFFIQFSKTNHRLAVSLKNNTNTEATIKIQRLSLEDRKKGWKKEIITEPSQVNLAPRNTREGFLPDHNYSIWIHKSSIMIEANLEYTINEEKEVGSKKIVMDKYSWNFCNRSATHVSSF